jgi:DNA-binding NarL/FixJ family response regulator
MHAKLKSSDLVLVVDDSPDTVAMLNDTLENEGITTLVSLEGKQAINIARKMSPDLILLDAVMPGTDGFEVCKILKSDPELKSIPVIFMTGLKDSESVIKGFEAGGVDYVTKPLVNEELIARIRVHLANARLTMSAQSALDSTGQYMFAVNLVGEIIWSTPQVNHLLEAASSADWVEKKLPLEISTWLSHQPNIGMGLELKSPRQALKVILLGENDGGELLLRLVDTQKPNEAETLKSLLPITSRESEVLLWIARGKTNREIGQIIGTSPRTVNKHLEQIYRKLSVENRTAAAAKALQFLAR